MVVHCGSEQQARYIRDAIAQRLGECQLELNQKKTRIVYCKDGKRRKSAEHERFDFLGYGFRPRLVRGIRGYFVSFSAAVSDSASKALRWEIRRWRLHLRSSKTLEDLAQEINVIVRGWVNYYGRYFKTRLYPTLQGINDYLGRWAQRKYKRLRDHQTRTRRWLARVAQRDPNLFVHWQFGARP